MLPCLSCRAAQWLLHEPARAEASYVCLVYRLPPALALLGGGLPLAPSGGGPAFQRQLQRAWLPHWRLRLLLHALVLALALRWLLPASLLPLRAPGAALLLPLAAAPLLLHALLPRRVVAERVEALGGGAGLACSLLREDGSEEPRAPLPQAAIASVVLNEGLHACGARYYLAAVVREGCCAGKGGAAAGGLFLPLRVATPRLPVLVDMLAALGRVYNSG